MAYPPVPPSAPFSPGGGRPTPTAANKHRGWIVAAVLFGVLFCLVGTLVVGGMIADKKQKPTTPAPLPTTRTGEVEKSAGVKGAPPATKVAAVPSRIGDGQWLVGEDVKAGIYRTGGAKERAVTFCQWTVKAGDESGAELLDFGSATGTQETGRVRLRNGQVFDTHGCQDWVRR